VLLSAHGAWASASAATDAWCLPASALQPRGGGASGDRRCGGGLDVGLAAGHGGQHRLAADHAADDAGQPDAGQLRGLPVGRGGVLFFTNCKFVYS
jgi:hypothetical protein